ncbi:MAG: DUF5720 family protein [Oscillospiraceae bacterium]|nr:DUF5720 family protein [Oscillospiraceae bacterium]
MEGFNRSAAPIVQGHDLLALERFMDTTRHMIEFDVLTWDSPVGDKGGRYRTFLSDAGYEKAVNTEKRGDIKIRKHARVVEGHILYDKKKQHER